MEVPKPVPKEKTEMFAEYWHNVFEDQYFFDAEDMKYVNAFRT